MKQNVRGTQNPMAATAPGPLKVPMLIGSQSYNRAIPILSLPGRGIDLNLTLGTTAAAFFERRALAREVKEHRHLGLKPPCG